MPKFKVYFSKGHIREQVLTCDDSFEGPIARIGNSQYSQLHMPENVQNLLQSVCALSQERGLDHVWPHIDHLVPIRVTDILHFPVGPVSRVEVAVEAPVLELLVCQGDLREVTHTSELPQRLLPPFNVILIRPRIPVHPVC